MTPADPGAPAEAARPATAADLPTIVTLAAALRTEIEPHRGGALWVGHDAEPAPGPDALLACLEADDELLLAGTLDDQVLGYCRVHLEPMRTGEVLGVVEELYVDPDARSVSLGETLLNAAVAWAVEHDCVGMDATALPGDREAKNFFETAGFTARRLVMHKRLT